jgi:hypothetical protein
MLARGVRSGPRPRPIDMKPFVTALCIALCVVPLRAGADAACRVTSAATLRPLVELYTSEGCDSCPPADRWLSAAFADPAIPANALAFHVDYWDRLGWKDRFASAAYTERQYRAAHATGAGFVYTPQVLLQGRDFTWRDKGAVAALAQAATQPARATIEVSAEPSGATLRAHAVARISDASARKDAALWLAYVDNGLTSDVKAGENRGVRLAHDRVVRALAGGARADAQGLITVDAALSLPAERGRAPAVVAFVQRAGNWDVLQSVALPVTDCPPH